MKVYGAKKLPLTKLSLYYFLSKKKKKTNKTKNREDEKENNITETTYGHLVSIAQIRTKFAFQAFFSLSP